MKTLRFWAGFIMLLMSVKLILQGVYGHPQLSDNQYVAFLIFGVVGAFFSVCICWQALGRDESVQKKISFDDVMCFEIEYLQAKAQLEDVEKFIESSEFEGMSKSRQENAFKHRVAMRDKVENTLYKLNRCGIYPS